MFQLVNVLVDIIKCDVYWLDVDIRVTIHLIKRNYIVFQPALIDCTITERKKLCVSFVKWHDDASTIAPQLCEPHRIEQDCRVFVELSKNLGMLRVRQVDLWMTYLTAHSALYLSTHVLCTQYFNLPQS